MLFPAREGMEPEQRDILKKILADFLSFLLSAPMGKD
jgi:hypothetical protein